jgi:hypothetical protein
MGEIPRPTRPVANIDIPAKSTSAVSSAVMNLLTRASVLIRLVGRAALAGDWLPVTPQHGEKKGEIRGELLAP